MQIELMYHTKYLSQMIDDYDGEFEYVKKDKAGLDLNPKTGKKIIKLGGKYKRILVLAHEIAHATRPNQPKSDDFYKTATEYSKAQMLGEGEAIYWEEISKVFLGIASKRLKANRKKKIEEIEKDINKLPLQKKNRNCKN
jgi:hypothetical protein